MPPRLTHKTNESQEEYERGDKKQILLDSLNDTISQRGRKFVLISGESGTGKTVLASTLQKASLNADFIHGKFDQFQKKSQNVLAAAFGQYASKLREDSHLLKSVQESVGQDARCLIDMITDLSADLFPVTSETGEADRKWMEDMTTIKSRTRGAFLRYVSAICRPSRPCILFIDDLQWASQADFQVISDLLTSKSVEIEGLLVVGACRVVDQDHELSKFIRSLSEKLVIRDVVLSNLSELEVKAYLESLYPTLGDKDLSSLAAMVSQQTEGNLFFVTQLLNNLLAQNVIVTRKGSPPCLDQAKLEARTKSEDVLDFIVANLRCLSHDTQQLLRVASGLGVRFSLVLLQCVLPRKTFSTDDVNNLLMDCTQKKILTSTTLKTPPVSLVWSFAHDRIQQAAYLLIPLKEQKNFHLSIGRTLRDQLDKVELEKHLLLVTSHLMAGAELMESQEEKDRLAALCFSSGQKSVAQSNFDDAGSFIDFGLGLLGESKWTRNYELCLQLFNAGAEVSYVRADYMRLEDLTGEVFLHATSFEDTIESHTTHVFALGSRRRLQEAIDEGLQVLEKLGEPLPKNFSPSSMRYEHFKTKRKLASWTERSLLELPPMKDPNKLAAMRMMNLIYSYTFWSGDPRALLITYRTVQMSLKHGLCAMSSVAFSFYAGYLCLFGDIDKGNRYGELALRIMDRFHSKQWGGRVMITVNSFVRPWKMRLDMLVDGLDKASKQCYITGDIEYAMMGEALSTSYGFMTGNVPLPDCHAAAVKFHEKVLRLEQNVVLSLFQPLLQLMANLNDQADDPLVLSGSFMDETSLSNKYMLDNNLLGQSVFYLCKGIVAFFLSDFKLAADSAQKAKGLKKAMNMCAPMTHLQLLFEGMGHLLSDKPYIRGAKVCLREMQWHARFAPTVLSGHIALLEAELVAVTGHNADGPIEKFELAIAVYQRQRCIHLQAFACERAAICLSRFGKTSEVAKYRIEALELYRKWGCDLKVRQLEQLLASEK